MRMQALVGGLHSGLALEIARFPKLFKRLAVRAQTFTKRAQTSTKLFKRLAVRTQWRTGRQSVFKPLMLTFMFCCI